MAVIEVQPLGDEHFDVTIEQDGSVTNHIVTATAKHVELLCGGCEPGHLVEASIRFLLDREPQRSIMSQFDLDVISSFFPDYHITIDQYL